MKKQILSVLAAGALLLTGCGAAENQAAAEIPVAEQVAAPVKTEEELTAELEEKREALSEEAFIDYMNTERKAELNLPDSAKYNPDLDVYYDSEVQEWDAENQRYIYVEKAAAQLQTKTDFELKDVEIPAALQAALDECNAAMNVYLAENPQFIFRSDYYWLDDTEALRTLKANTQVQYFETWFDLARWRLDPMAQSFVAEVIFPKTEAELAEAKPASYRQEEYASHMADLFRQAAEAVTSLGESITAEDCAELQKQYGYLIAPALQDMGKLDLLQIDPDSPCTDAEQLAEFARYFAA